MADSPKEGEAAQALFCAIADFLGDNITKKEFDLENIVHMSYLKKLIRR